LRFETLIIANYGDKAINLNEKGTEEGNLNFNGMKFAA